MAEFSTQIPPIRPRSTPDRGALPTIPKALLEALEEMFPDKLPSEAVETAAGINFKAGAVSVIRKLREEYRRQTENILNRDVMSHDHR